MVIHKARNEDGGSCRFSSSAIGAADFSARGLQPLSFAARRMAHISDEESVPANVPLASIMGVNPRDVFYSQDSISRYFSDGRSIFDTRDWLSKDPIQRAAQLPSIRVVAHEGKWVSLDNRRLWCLKEVGAIRSIGVRVLDLTDPSVSNEFYRKFTRPDLGGQIANVQLRPA